MPDYYVSSIRQTDARSMKQVEDLLLAEGIRRDAHLDYTCGIFDDYGKLIATGSCFDNTMRCFAVSSNHRGEGLLNQIVTHLIEFQFGRGNSHLFVYTKYASADFFRDLGFYEIVRTDDDLVFMENAKTGFSSYLASLDKTRKDGTKIAAIVMNANPFSLGHQYLVSHATSENDVVHLFMVSDDCSLIPYAVRKKLILEGTSQFSNLIYHDTGSYLISNATFPSYFQKDDVSVICGHAHLDLFIFCKIAEKLGITARYVGEEPNSLVTGIYNQIMKEELPAHGISCVELPRLMAHEKAISASDVRLAIKTGDYALLKTLVPENTYRYFISEEASDVVNKIKNSEDVIHY